MTRRFLRTALTSFTILLLCGGAIRSLEAQSASVTLQVPGTADPWLAGMPNSSTASCEAGVCDNSPAESPALVTGLAIIPGATLTFSATGQVSYGPTHPMAGPDGGLNSSGQAIPVQHDNGAENGISDVLTNLSSLIGVFLGPDRPDLTAAPSIGGVLAKPGLKQVFVIGSNQTVVVPAGATRLYLATMDGYEWGNNPGAFTVTVSLSPAPTAVTPAVSTGSNQIYTFQFSDAAGWKALSVVNVLINNSLDGRQACYLAYSVPGNVLYLVADNGGTLLPGLVLNGAGNTSNSQCTVRGVDSSASGNGNTLTLTLDINFSASFAGNKVVYTAARDAANNSGWQTLGVSAVTPLPVTYPEAIGMTPPSGNASNATITFTYQDVTAANNLQTMWALMNTALDGRSACYVAYYAPGNAVYLIPDNGDGTQAKSMPLSGTGTLSNSQCTISATGSQFVRTGAQAALTLNVTFNPSFAGPKIVWMASQPIGGAAAGAWQALGAWNVPGN